MTYKIINTHIYAPSSSIFGKKNDKAEMFQISCNNYENCDLYKKQQCIYRRAFVKICCPYGKTFKETGYTQRAKKYYNWISKRQELYKDSIGKLSPEKGKMA